MSLVEKVNAIAKEQMDELAQRIRYELKSACPKRTGEAASSIHIEKISDTQIRIGAENLHLYFADQGNGPGSIPRNGSHKVMPISGGNGQWIAFRTGPFSSYEGKHFVRDVANRHR